MGKLTLALLAALLLGALVFVGCQPSDRYDPVRAAREDAEAARIAQAAELDAQAAPIVATAWLVTRVAFILMLPIGAALGGAALWRRFWVTHRLVRADTAGVLPVYVDQLDELAPHALTGYHAARLEDARRVHNPAALTYSPHYAYRSEATGVLHDGGEQPTPTLTLPDSVALGDVLPTLAPGKLCYGVLPGGEPLVLTFGQAYHALAAGDTRTGKSNYLDATIVQLHHQQQRYPLRLLIGDFKREMAATWRRSPLVETVETDPAVIADMLVSLTHDADGILDRYAQFERIGNQQQRIIRNIADWGRVTGERPRLTFCVIDELNALIEAAEKRAELASALKVVLQTGAGAGCYVLGGAQYLTAKVFGRDGSKQFTTRALFGAYDQTASGVVFGAGKLGNEHRALLTGAPGRGLIRTAGQAQPTPFQALHCTEGDILEAVRALPADAPTVEAGETLKQPRNPPETPETSFGISPDVAQIVRRWRDEGRSKKETISLLWGAKPGSSAAYKQASAAYDAIVSERSE